MELLLSIIGQLLMQADLLLQIEPGFLYAIKDCIMFGIPQLLGLLQESMFMEVPDYTSSERLLKKMSIKSILEKSKVNASNTRF